MFEQDETFCSGSRCRLLLPAAARQAISRWMYQVYKGYMKYTHSLAEYTSHIYSIHKLISAKLPWHVTQRVLIILTMMLHHFACEVIVIVAIISSPHSHRFTWNIYSHRLGYFHFPCFAFFFKIPSFFGVVAIYSNILLLPWYDMILLRCAMHVQDRYGSINTMGGRERERERETENELLYIFGVQYINIYTCIVICAKLVVYEFVMAWKNARKPLFFPIFHKLRACIFCKRKHLRAARICVFDVKCFTC